MLNSTTACIIHSRIAGRSAMKTRYVPLFIYFVGLMGAHCKTILIVGASVSASEIARDIAPYARHVLASLRVRSYLFRVGLY